MTVPSFLDDVGTVLADDETARKEAIEALAGMSKDLPPDNGLEVDMAIKGRDYKGHSFRFAARRLRRENALNCPAPYSNFVASCSIALVGG